LGVSSYCPVHNENPLPKPDSGDGGGGKHPPAVRDIIEAPFRVHIADLQQRIDKLQAALAERDEARAEADRLSTELGATEDAAHVLEWQLERSQSRVDELTAKLARVRDHLKPLDRWDDLAGELLAILDSEVEPLRVTVDDYDDDWMRVEGNIPSLSTEPQSGDAFLLVPAKEKR
jgi:chromosome segregation ATPase